MTEHFRTLLLLKIASPHAPFLALSATYHEKYQESAKFYTQEQCLTILDFLVEALNEIRFAPSARIALEALLLRILRVQQRIPVEFLVRQLQELEQAVGSQAAPKPPVTANVSMTVDPTPSAKDLGIKVPKATLPTPNPSPIPTPLPPAPPPPPPAPNPQTPDAPPAEPRAALTPEEQAAAIKKQSRYDTLLQFATVELEGSLQKTHNKGF